MKIIGSVYEHNAIFRHLDLYVHDIGELERVLQMYPEEDKIVYWMMVNNITGTVFNVEEIGRLCHKYGAYYIMDAVAAVGHYPISNNLESFCDCLITSAHKYGGPQGTGCMWISDRFAKFLGLSDDSHEEYGLIHGTPNVSAAVAMSYAMKHAVREAKTNNIVWGQLVNYMCTKLLENGILHHIQDIENTNKTYAINALYLPNINGDALTQYLSSKSIYISPGHSACTSDDNHATRVLEAFGLTKQEASQTVRVSFGESTSQEDIDALVQGIVEFKEMFV